MKSIDWSPRPARSLICPICDQRSEMEHVMRSEPFNPWLGKVALSLYHCAACGSYHYPDAREPSYESFGEQNGQYDASYVKFYVEQGCGLDSMIAPFFAVERSRIKSYLEIGCGFGMALDFAGRGLGWRALGLEPSMIGSTGAALLGTRVEPIYLKTGTRLEDGPFDLVMASEVIEHVTDPGAFLDGIGHALSAQGALVLTTPNAAAVSRETPESALVPILTPGMHMVLFTAESLRLLLQRHGYPHVTVKDTGYGLLAVATREPMAVDLEDSFDHRLYQAYLRERFETLSGQTRLASGFGYQGGWAGGLRGPTRPGRGVVRLRSGRPGGGDPAPPTGRKP
jgi:SAM-dependent methyltransferase